MGKDAGDSVFDNIGETGGEKTHIMTAGELAAHNHSFSTGNESAGHVHGVSGISISSGGSHSHSVSGDTISTGTHSHEYGRYVGIIYVASGSESACDNTYQSLNTVSAGYHSHTISGTASSAGSHSHNISGTTNGTSANHTHNGTTNDSAGGDAHNNLQPYVVLNFIIRYQSYAAPKKGAKGDKGEKGDRGDKGDATPFVQAQYSANGESWHSSYITGDGYVRFSADGGNVWGETVYIRGPEGQQGIQGERGIQGLQGEQGIQGAQGERGIQGIEGEKGVSYRMLGEYNAGTPYVNDPEYIDCVTYYGSSYYAKKNSTGTLPGDNEYWGVLAQKGLNGQGAGDVIGPVSNTDSKFPQWDGNGTNTLKDGYSLQDLMLALYPVGAIYLSVVNTPPELLFGGTWEPIAPGRMLAGYDTADPDFNSVEVTGGEKSHALLISEMPQHTHGQSSHSHSIAHDHGAATSGGQSADHSHGISINSLSSGTHSHNIQWYQGQYISLSGNGSGDSSSGYRTGYTSGTVYRDATLAASAGSHNHLVSGNSGGASAGHTHSVDLPNFTGNSASSTATNDNTGGGGAHNNLPPYMVVYMWKRTA